MNDEPAYLEPGGEAESGSAGWRRVEGEVPEA